MKCEANVVHTGSKPVEEAIEKFSPQLAELEEGWGVKGRLTGSSGPVQLASGTGELTAGSDAVTVPGRSARNRWGGYGEGYEQEEITGEGIPAGTLITKVTNYSYPIREELAALPAGD